jgi:hypothetical protein
LEERVPTCAFTLKGKSPHQVAEELDEANIYVWDGNYYALEVTKRLGLEESGGMVRVEAVPQNRWFTTKHPVFSCGVPALWGRPEELGWFGEEWAKMRDSKIHPHG